MTVRFIITWFHVKCEDAQKGRKKFSLVTFSSGSALALVKQGRKSIFDHIKAFSAFGTSSWSSLLCFSVLHNSVLGVSWRKYLSFRWRCPRTRWQHGRRQWARPSMAVAASSSSWAGWAYCPVCTDSYLAADELWSLDIKLSFSQSSPSWWRRHIAMASGHKEQLEINRPIPPFSLQTTLRHTTLLWHFTQPAGSLSHSYS